MSAISARRSLPGAVAVAALRFTRSISAPTGRRRGKRAIRDKLASPVRAERLATVPASIVTRYRRRIISLSVSL
jgi:hypothetical protein